MAAPTDLGAIVNSRKLEHGSVLGFDSLIVDLRGRRIMMFQLSGFYYNRI